MPAGTTQDTKKDAPAAKKHAATKKKSEEKPTTEDEKKTTEETTPEEPEEPIADFCQNYRVITKVEFGRVQLREFDNIDVDGAAVIEGFPDEGVVSPLAAGYLVEAMKLPLIGDIVSPVFAPVAVLRNGFASHGITIYGNKKLVVFTSQYEINDPEIANDIVEAILDFCSRHKARMILSVNGITDDPNKKKEKIPDLKFKLAGGGAGGDDEEGDEEMGDEGEEVSLNELAGDDEESEESEQPPQSKEELMEMLEKALSEEQQKNIWYITNSQQLGLRMRNELKWTPMRESLIGGISGGILAEAPTRQGITIAFLFTKISKTLQIGLHAGITLLHAIDQLIQEPGSSDKLIDTTQLSKTAADVESKIRKVFGKLGGIKDAHSSYEHMFL